MNDFLKKLGALLGTEAEQEASPAETEEPDNTIVLTDDDGNDVEFEFLDLVPYNGDEYVVMLPKEDDADEVVILKLAPGETEDEESYEGVEDDEILQAVFDIFKDKFKDEFDFGE